MSINTLDCRGLICPMPVIQLQKFVREHPAGTQLQITCTDPGTQHDIPAWCRIHGYTVNQVEVNHDKEICFDITLA